MMKRSPILFMLMVALLLGVQMSMAQGTSRVYAAVVDDNVFVYGIVSEPAQVTFNVPSPDFSSSAVSSLLWSADGQTLAFVQRVVTPNADSTTTITREIVVVSLANNVIVNLAVNPSLAYPINFLADGRVMFTQEGDFPEGSRNARMMNVLALALTEGAMPEQIGSFVTGIGCGGGSSFPHDMIYWEEAGGFQGNAMFLAETSIGIVHTLDCSGNGLGLLSPDGNSTILTYDIRRARLSPDKDRVLGISGDDLIVYTLSTRNEQRIDIRSVPNQVAWGANGTSDIFYSVITEGPTLRVQEEADIEKFNALLGYAPEAIATYGVNIRKYNLSNQDDAPIYGGFGSAVGRMVVSPDGSQLFFSQIPNPNAWVDAVKAGQLGDMGTRNIFNERALLPVEVLVLDLSANPVTSAGIGTNQRQITFNFSR